WAKAEAERQRLALLQHQEEERKRLEAAKKAAEAAAKRKADDEARAKAEAERQRLAMLEQRRQVEARNKAPPATGEEGRAREGGGATAVGVARVSKEHPREEAVRSARDLARAKIISGSNMKSSVDSSVDAAIMLTLLSSGVTYEETWTMLDETADELKVEL